MGGQGSKCKGKDVVQLRQGGGSPEGVLFIADLAGYLSQLVNFDCEGSICATERARRASPLRKSLRREFLRSALPRRPA